MLPGTVALPILTRFAPIIIQNDFCQAPRNDLTMLFSSRMLRWPFTSFLLHDVFGRELRNMTIGCESNQVRMSLLELKSAIPMAPIRQCSVLH